MKKDKSMSGKTLIALALVAIMVIFGTAAYLLTSTKSLLSKEETQSLISKFSPEVGQQDAKVVIVEFFNPSCGTCGAFNPIVNDILQKNDKKVKVIYRLLPFNNDADYMIKMLLAANNQGKFKESIDVIFANRGTWLINNQFNIFGAWKLLEQAGVDKARAVEYLNVNAEKIQNEIEQNNRDADILGVNKTPTFFVNDKELKVLRENLLFELVDQELKRVY